MKDLGEARIRLGVEMHRDRTNRELFISQSQYSYNILKRLGMKNSRTFVPPMDKSYAERTALASKPVKNVPYGQVIGSLMWWMVGSRSDLAYAIRRMSQHSESRTEYHWMAVKRVLCYLNATRNHGVLYDGSLSIEISGYSDSDWAGCRSTRKSTSRYVFLVAGELLAEDRKSSHAHHCCRVLNI